MIPGLHFFCSFLALDAGDLPLILEVGLATNQSSHAVGSCVSRIFIRQKCQKYFSTFIPIFKLLSPHGKAVKGPFLGDAIRHQDDLTECFIVLRCFAAKITFVMS